MSCRSLAVHTAHNHHPSRSVQELERGHVQRVCETEVERGGERGRREADHQRRILPTATTRSVMHTTTAASLALQGYLAHKKQPPL